VANDADLRQPREAVLEERSLDAPAQRFGAAIVVEQAGHASQKRSLERVLIAAVIAELEVLANLLLAIGVYFVIEIVPHTPDDVLARNVIHTV
jgi:hypothetical protein